MILTNGAQNSIQVYLWDNDNLNFVPDSSLYVEINGTVQNIVPGDINYDGKLDVLVTYTQDSDTFMQIILQTNEVFNAELAIKIPNNSQPVLLDLNLDLMLEILLNVEDLNENATAAVYSFSDSLEFVSNLNSFLSESDGCLQFENLEISYPHSIGFVDLNKDCLPDLFITINRSEKLYFEVWLNVKNGLYCNVLSEAAPDGAQQVSFADIDRNGVEDIIFPVCVGIDCNEKQEIHIVYNHNEVSNDCSFSDTATSKFELSDLNASVSIGNKLIIPVSLPFYAGNGFPIAIRFGDFNLDGYPDALATFYNSTEGNQSPHIEYYENVKCEHCSNSQRTLEKSDLEGLKTIKGALFSCFFDLDDNGILDIIVVSNNGSQFLVTSFYNNFLNDAFHLKALALNGYKERDYSSAFPGAVFMFTLTELDMSKVIMHSTQMPLTGFYALNTPYCVYGLGRTNSYIEEFYVAMPLKKDNFRAWTPIIPNSYLIASPDRNKVDDWYLELFASPTDKIGIIIGVCLVCMVLIGLIVIYNYCKEKKEDKILFSIKYF